MTIWAEILRKAAAIVDRGLSAITHNTSRETGKVGAVFRAIASSPFQVIAAFFAAPFLLLSVAWTGGQNHDFIRRAMAIVGLALSIIFVYAVNIYFLGFSMTLLIVDNIGLLAAIVFAFGFLFGSYVSVSMLILAFWFICFLFLKMTSQEVADYLRDRVT